MEHIDVELELPANTDTKLFVNFSSSADTKIRSPAATNPHTARGLITWQIKYHRVSASGYRCWLFCALITIALRSPVLGYKEIRSTGAPKPSARSCATISPGAISAPIARTNNFINWFSQNWSIFTTSAPSSPRSYYYNRTPCTQFPVPFSLPYVHCVLKTCTQVTPHNERLSESNWQRAASE